MSTYRLNPDGLREPESLAETQSFEGAVSRDAKANEKLNMYTHEGSASGERGAELA